ncbi:tetratricopeptide repeat protein [Halopseudomonas pachastrellae]|nr:tetratricopeptide repeat protein [Halopseudomonas pachastrellae]
MRGLRHRRRTGRKTARALAAPWRAAADRVALALAGVFGWNAWQNYQTTQAQNASTLYQSMMEAVLASDTEASRARAAELARTAAR